jgi:hypothetical protein
LGTIGLGCEITCPTRPTHARGPIPRVLPPRIRRPRQGDRVLATRPTLSARSDLRTPFLRVLEDLLRKTLANTSIFLQRWK